MKNKVSALAKKYQTFLIYSVIGASGALLDFVLFLVLYNTFGVPPVVATSISVLAGITNNFILNTLFNFKKKDNILFRYIVFTSVGLLGLFLSIYILAFGEVFAVNPNVSKLLSIPVIVVFQYLLNKKFSFKDFNDQFKAKNAFWQILKKNWGLILINCIFLIFSLHFLKSLPAEGQYAGPDEVAHYKYDVNFIRVHHRLPVSGKDDLSAYKSCTIKVTGSVPCAYSYVTYPGANYVFSAVTSVAAHEIVGVSFLKGARLASLMWGLAFLNLMYLLAVRLTRNRRISWAIASIGLIPEVVFTCSYVNQDAHSLAIGALCVYALVRLLQDRNNSAIVLAGLAFGGLLPLAKYNYYILLPAAAIVVIVAMVRKKLSTGVLLRLILAGIILFSLLSAFWFVRSYILYHDPLGQSFVVKEMLKYGKPGLLLPYNLHTIVLFTQANFFVTLFNSFFVAFGGMTIFMAQEKYSIIQAALILGSLYVPYLIVTSKQTRRRPLLAGVFVGIALLLAGVIALVLFNSIKYDFQPQGRYLFPILAPIAAALAVGYNQDNRYKYVIFGFVFVVAYCLFNSIDLILRYYV